MQRVDPFIWTDTLAHNCSYDAGTTFSPQGLFENDVMDKAARIEQLSNGDSVDDREQVDLAAPHETKYIGTIAVDETLDGMARPLGDVKHLDCYGRDDDPECQTSAAPLFDKVQTTSELSTKQAGKDLDMYFAQQQKQAARVRKPITPKMQGGEKMKENKGTKFGLSTKAARQQAKAIFGAAPRQVKQHKTQLKLDTRAADKQVDAIFSDISKGVHGANNGALLDDNKAAAHKYDEEKLITSNMKSTKTQQLRINHGMASKVTLWFWGHTLQPIFTNATTHILMPNFFLDTPVACVAHTCGVSRCFVLLGEECLGALETLRNIPQQRLQCQAYSTRWQRLIGSLIFIGHFQQKSPIFSVSFVQNGLQLKGSQHSAASSAPSTLYPPL